MSLIQIIVGLIKTKIFLGQKLFLKQTDIVLQIYQDCNWDTDTGILFSVSLFFMEFGGLDNF